MGLYYRLTKSIVTLDNQNDSSLDVRQAAETAIKNLASSVENYL